MTVKKKTTKKPAKKVLQKEKPMTINEVDSFKEFALYFLEYILIKHFFKIVIFSIILGLTISGFNCKTKWFSFEKKEIKVKSSLLSTEGSKSEIKQDNPFPQKKQEFKK